MCSRRSNHRCLMTIPGCSEELPGVPHPRAAGWSLADWPWSTDAHCYRTSYTLRSLIVKKKSSRKHNKCTPSQNKTKQTPPPPPPPPPTTTTTTKNHVERMLHPHWSSRGANTHAHIYPHTPSSTHHHTHTLKHPNTQSHTPSHTHPHTRTHHHTHLLKHTHTHSQSLINNIKI